MPIMYCERCFGNTGHEDKSRAYKDSRLEVFKCEECKRNKTYGY